MNIISKLMTDPKEKYFAKAIEWAQKKADMELKSVHPDFEDTKIFTNKATQEETQADISFIRSNGKHFTEIAVKTDNPRKLVTRWKLLSMMANMKRGKLHLLAPKGHKMFTQRMVEQYSISAKIYSL